MLALITLIAVLNSTNSVHGTIPPAIGLGIMPVTRLASGALATNNIIIQDGVYVGYSSLSWRGSIMLQSIPYQWYPSSCPPLQVALHDEWGIFKIGVNYNGTHGVFAFDGQTALATNLAAYPNF